MYDGSGEANEIDALFSDPDSGARRVALRPGEALFDTSAGPADVYFVHAGELRLFQVGPDDSARLGGIFGAGDWVGTTALAGFADYVVRGVATTPCDVSALPVARLLELLHARPVAAVAMLKEMAVRLMLAYDAAARLVFDDCNERLVKALITLSHSPAATRDGETVTLRITHQQLAQNVGAARETISLALTELRHKNLLATGRNRLMFNPDALRSCTARRPRKDRAAAARPEPAISAA